MSGSGISSGRGRAKRLSSPPPTLHKPEVIKGIPAGLESDSDEDDDDYYVSHSINLASKGSGSRTVLPGTGIGSSSTHSREVLGKSTADDSWDPPPEPKRQAQQTTGRVSNRAMGSNYSRRMALPKIPNINEQRAIAACRSINTTWSNGDLGRDIHMCGIAAIIRKEFSDAVNPYCTALNMMLYSIDFFKPTKYNQSLALEVMQEFKKWLLDSGGLASFERRFLDTELQRTAFAIITQQSFAPIIKIVCELYCLPSIREHLLEPIDVLCAEGNHRVACLVATYLGVGVEFDIHKFVIPCLLQDKESVAFDYLVTSKENHEAVVAFFDGILGEENPGVAIKDYVCNRKLENVQFTKLEAKPLSKLLDRIRKKFGTDLLNCPNSDKRKRTQALKHLMYRKYVLNDASMSLEAFEELVDSTVDRDEMMVEEAIYQFQFNMDYVGAAKFALRNSIALHKIPREIQIEMNKINPNVVSIPDSTCVQPWDEDWDLELEETGQTKLENTGNTLREKSRIPLTPAVQNPVRQRFIPASDPLEENNDTKESGPDVTQSSIQTSLVDQNYQEHEEDVPFYECRIKISEFHNIDTPEKVDFFLERIEEARISNSSSNSKPGSLVVGFDSEWKPMFGEPGVALIQVATFDEIFLIDTYQLKRNPGEQDHWALLLENFFKNENILKLGFGLKNDYKMLSETNKTWSDMKSDFKGSIDLSQLATLLRAASPEILPLNLAKQNEFSLSQMVLAVTGLRLNKEEQFSNWESRPLRKAQILYAATDAYCLVDVFNILKGRAESLGVNFDDILTKLIKKKTAPMVAQAGQRQCNRVLMTT